MIRSIAFGLLLVASAAPMVAAGEQASVQAPASQAKRVFMKPAILRGTLGDAQIQVSLRPKEKFEGGVEGDYFLFGHSNRVLLAGEVEGDEMLLEESENGTDVSGQWSGKMAGDVMRGEWQSADGAVTKPFQLRLVRVGGK